MRFWLLKTRWFGIELLTTSKSELDFTGHDFEAMALVSGLPRRRQSWTPCYIRRRLQFFPGFLVGLVQFRKKASA